jgi:hypothetical protein
MGLYHPLDGVTILKYKLSYFLIPNKKTSKRKALAFNREILPHGAPFMVDSLPLETFPLVEYSQSNILGQG